MAQLPRAPAVAAALLFAIPGCLYEAPECQGSDCATSSTSIAPPTNTATLAAFNWTECDGLVTIFTVPFENARAAIPPAFTPYGIAPRTADMLAVGAQCGRVSIRDRVVENVGYFQVEVRVQLANSSWGERGTQSRYVLDILATSSEVADALRATGVPAVVGQLERSDMPAGDITVRRWKYQTANWTAELEYPLGNAEGGGFDDVLDYYWFPAGDEFVRMDKEWTLLYDHTPILVGGVLRLSGSSTSATVIGTCCKEWAGQGIQTDEENWKRSPAVFLK